MRDETARLHRTLLGEVGDLEPEPGQLLLYVEGGGIGVHRFTVGVFATFVRRSDISGDGLLVHRHVLPGGRVRDAGAAEELTPAGGVRSAFRPLAASVGKQTTDLEPMAVAY